MSRLRFRCLCHPLRKYIHGQRLVLQFLTPDNIWISKEDKAYIVNFDTTVEFRNSTAGSVLVADKTTFSHPKSNDKNNSGLMTATNSNDIYSLSAILYYALSSIESRNILNRVGDDLPTLNDVNIDINTAIRKALNQGLTNRYSNLYDFYEDLGLYKESSISDSFNSNDKVIANILLSISSVKSISTSCKNNVTPTLDHDLIKELYESVSKMIKDVIPKQELDSVVSRMIEIIVPNSKRLREDTPNKKKSKMILRG